MTSAINPQSIDENFPVAGQDNDSQGFRDNFSIIKNSLAIAEGEISELQNNVILKGPIADIESADDIDNNFNGVTISNVQTNRVYGSVYPIEETTGTTVINYEDGEFFKVNIKGNHTLRFENWPLGRNEDGVYAKLRLSLSTQDTDISLNSITYDVTLTSSGGTMVNVEGTSSILSISTGVETIVDVWTIDGGDTVYFANIGVVDSTFGVATLGDVGDVTVDTPIEGDIVQYQEGIGWVNASDPNLITYYVKVEDDGSSSQSVFHFSRNPDDEWLPIVDSDGNKSKPVLSLYKRYRFDLSDPSNVGYALGFSSTPDTPGNEQPWTDDVFFVGTVGTSGAFAEILITENTPNPLYFYAQEVPPTQTQLVGAAEPISIQGYDYYKGSEDLDTSSLVDLTKTVSWFETDAPETSTLEEGIEGQIKTFAMYGDNGDMVITVSNAGWKLTGTGTITFTDIGQACTLQYINNKWFCIGNNGATFA